MKYEKDLKEYNENLNLWQQQQQSYAYRVGNNNNNIKKPRKPTNQNLPRVMMLKTCHINKKLIIKQNVDLRLKIMIQILVELE